MSIGTSEARPSTLWSLLVLLYAATILFPAALAALTYALIAVSTPRDDLGAWPPVDQLVPPKPVTAESALPSSP